MGHNESNRTNYAQHFVGLLALALGCALPCAPAFAVDEIESFEVTEVISGLEDPSGLVFSPDGRMFIAERIEGRLLVAHQDGATGDWLLASQPFHEFDVPHDSSGNPERHRSSGLRGFVFDPDFATNRRLYAFSMRHSPRHNQVLRLTARADQPDLSDPSSELVLLDLPFNSTSSSGSHNGGALAFGGDGMLYVATGDGWNGGDSVQSLQSCTGKIFRIASDGTIPSDNPFYAQTSGDLRAVYALGLRNPFTMSRHPVTGQLFINDVAGSDKADVLLLEPGANYGHQGFSGVGASRAHWVNAGSIGGSVITGGVWYPNGGPFPVEYHGAYFVPLWGRNFDAGGRIHVIQSLTNPTVEAFATDVLASGSGCSGGLTLKPVTTAVGPDGCLYYLATNYETGCGAIFRIAAPATPAPELTESATFSRGDINADGFVHISDPITLANFLLQGGPPPPCRATGDIDANGVVGIEDVMLLLSYVFSAGGPPAEPFPDCGVVEQLAVGACNSYAPCQ